MNLTLLEPDCIAKLDDAFSNVVTLVLKDPLVDKKLPDRVSIEALFASILVSNEEDTCKKLEDNIDIEELNEAVAAFNSASVANVASSDELNISKSVILTLLELLTAKKLDDNSAIEELFVNILVLKDADTSKKLDDNIAVDALNEAVAAFNSASVAKVAFSDELNCSKSVILVLVDPLATKKLPDKVPIEELFASILVSKEAEASKKLEDNIAVDALNDAVAALSWASVANVASSEELNVSKSVTLILKELLVAKKLPDNSPIEELFVNILVSNEADVCS